MQIKKTKKELEIKTTEETIKHLVIIQENLSALNPVIENIVFAFKYHRSFDKPPYQEINDKWYSTSEAFDNFFIFFESHEVILYKFIPICDSIKTDFDNLRRNYFGFIYFLAGLNYEPKNDNLKDSTELIDIIKNFGKLQDVNIDVNGHIVDLIRELQNTFLSQLFGYKIPKRKPRVLPFHKDKYLKT